jgi:hypothetical protein
LHGAAWLIGLSLVLRSERLVVVKKLDVVCEARFFKDIEVDVW